MTAFTDFKCGFRAAIPHLIRYGSLHPYAIITIGVLSAILLALRTLYPLQVGRDVIFCDSTVALSAIENIYSSHPLVRQIFIWIILCHRRGHQINFCWVPTHVSVEGNERADEVAKAASLRPPHACSLPFTDLFPSIRSAIQAAWEGRWERVSDRNKMEEITTRAVCPWSAVPMRQRRYETALTRLRMGDTRLTHGHFMSRGV